MPTLSCPSMPMHVENFQVYPEALRPGTEVGTWRVVERLGVGGFGAVYRVEDMARPGEFYALKLALCPGDERAEREVTLLMVKAVHPNVVRFHACGRWPHPRTGYLYFVMDWVAGRPLDTWAEECNPSFHDLAQAAGKLALAFDALHKTGVLHRDVKPAHLLIRESDGEPVLIDFGIGDYAGAVTITEQTIPPGTLHLRSPESVRFHRQNHGQPEARYAYQPTDDLYALGVSMYRAVTGHFPFPPHLPPDMLYLAIEGHTPPTPADFNRRTPQALSDVIMRLLAKEPRERYPTGAALHTALTAVVSAGNATEWEARLFEWEDAQGPVTDPGGPKRHIRRPEWPTRSATPAAPMRGLAPSWPFFRRGVSREPGAAMQGPPSAAPPKKARWLRPAVLSGVVLLVCVLGFAAWKLQPPSLHPAPGVSQVPAPHAVLVPAPAPPAASHAAVPPMAEATPVAAAPPAALPKEDSPVMKQPKPPAHSLKKVGRTAMGVAGVCLHLSCSSPQSPPRPQLRYPLPGPEACPPGALKAMEELGIPMGYRRTVVFDVIRGEPHVISVSAGETLVRLGEGWKGLRSGSVVSGQLFIGDRVYGRFTSATTYKSGVTYPVCLELYSVEAKRGMERKPGGDANSAFVFPVGELKPVDHFE